MRPVAHFEKCEMTVERDSSRVAPHTAGFEDCGTPKKWSVL
jgi:hypothetical protein